MAECACIPSNGSPLASQSKLNGKILVQREVCGEWEWGVSANTTASRILIHKRKKYGLAPHGSVATVGSNFKSLIPSSLI